MASSFFPVHTYQTIFTSLWEINEWVRSSARARNMIYSHSFLSSVRPWCLNNSVVNEEWIILVYFRCIWGNQIGKEHLPLCFAVVYFCRRQFFSQTKWHFSCYVFLGPYWICQSPSSSGKYMPSLKTFQALYPDPVLCQTSSDDSPDCDVTAIFLNFKLWKSISIQQNELWLCSFQEVHHSY